MPRSTKNQYKIVSVDTETYQLLTNLAAEECRSVGGQVRWMVKVWVANPPTTQLDAATQQE